MSVLFENVCFFCAKKNLSIHSLEQSAGLGNGTVRRWDVSSPKIESVQAVAKVLGVSMATLLKERK